MTQSKGIALVTGASRGIGAATAWLLAQNNYTVCINYKLQQRQAEKIEQKIISSNKKAFCVQADLSSEAEITRLFQHIDTQPEKLTALVNNAGMDLGRHTIEEISYKAIADLFEINSYAQFICCREAIVRMKKEKKGAIVNVSSEAAQHGSYLRTYYSASKAAINAFTKSVAREVAPYHIRVNTVSPGIITTDMTLADKTKSDLPLSRPGTPTEVANTILWLLDEKSAYITGSIVRINGGKQ